MNETENTIPVSEGTLTISIAEYRGLLEALYDARAEAKTKASESIDKGARLYDRGKQIELLEQRIAAMTAQAADFGAYLDAVPYRRSEYEMFLRGQALDRLAAEVETK